MKNHFQAPVLLIGFNRPDTTEKVFNKIREFKPLKLYVSVDGPRFEKPEEDKLVNEVQRIVKNVDWECDVQYRFLEKNIGCGMGVASAISWAFEKENCMIILEDDCVPSLSFFESCNYLLDKYKYDTRVWMISGRSHQADSVFFNDQDYVFSRYAHTWGWATWKRCWQHFDIYMNDFPDFLSSGGFLNVLTTDKEGFLFNKLYKKKYADKKLHEGSWDYQFGYAVLKNSGFCIVPAKNLIENIGYFGVHYSGKKKCQELKAYERFSIRKEPQFVMINKNYELLHFKNHIKKIHGKRPLHKRILNKGLKMLGLKR